MPLKLDDKLVIGVSSRALFDLEAENKIFEEEGLDKYSVYQIEHEKDILKPEKKQLYNMIFMVIQ